MDKNIAQILAIATKSNLKISIFDKESIETITMKKLSNKEWEAVRIELDDLNWFDIYEQIGEMVTKVKEG